MKKSILLGLILSVSAPLWAHAGAMHSHLGASFLASFGTGFLHPLLGWDHLLVILAVALNLHTLGRRMPIAEGAKKRSSANAVALLAFCALFGLGALLGQFSGTFGSLMKPLVLASVPVAIFLLLTPARASLFISGLFVLLHGAVHGAELAMSVGTLAGMLTAAGLLFAAVGFLCGQYQSLRLRRFSVLD